MQDPSNKDLVRLDGHTFITFNRATATLTCEHCRATETGVEQMQIISFAQAHRPCPLNATPDQQKAAQQRARALGFRARVHGGTLLTAEQRVRLDAIDIIRRIRASMRTPAEIEAKLSELRDRHAAIKPNGGNALAARQNITQAIGALQWVLGEEEQL